MVKFDRLFQPFRLGSLELKNRMVMAPLGTNLASAQGEVTPQLIAFLEARAKGGVGLIIVEDATIGPNYHQHTLSLAQDRVIPGWRELTSALRAHGAKTAAQIMHPAFNAPAGLNDGRPPVSASPIPSRLLREIPRELSGGEIEEVTEQFGQAARRAKEGGCDAIQLHCAHMHHLLGGFLSPYHNKRTDEYGGAIEGRLRLPLRVLLRVRRAVGPGYPIIVRVSGDEFLPGGLDPAEVRYAAPRLVEAGADALHVSGGTSLAPWTGVPPTGSPQAVNAGLAAEIKKTVKVPVICVGRISEPWAAEQVLETGQADLVCLGRALLADPDWPRKVARAETEDIAPCLGDTLCLRRTASRRHITCLINPWAGREGEEPLPPAASPRKVIVVGGGPAGLTAARVAAARGHWVTLLEKGPKLGGQLLMAAFPPAKQEYARAVQYLVRQAGQAGVRVELNQEATPGNIAARRPDVVLVATGGAPLLPPEIEGIRDPEVITAWDVLSGRVFPGPRLAVVGGGKVGCETADYLAHVTDDLSPGGNRVTVIEMLDQPCLDDLTPARALLIRRLKEKGVEFILGARVTAVNRQQVTYRRGEAEYVLAGLDAVVLALGVRPVDDLSGPLEAAGIPWVIVGDAKEPRNSLEAIREGFEAGRSI
ncbi:MAG: FAD-dependent oxidoreductase [Thermodesulfobacteriota bacterium]